MSGKLSVVVPVFNEEGQLGAFFARLEPILEGLDMDYEIIAVDDGSTDGSWQNLSSLRENCDFLRALKLSRNFGKEVAISAGLDAVAGDAVVIIDADLQHPPEMILDFIAKWREGYDVVYGVRRSRDDESLLKKLSARAFYRLLDVLSDTEIPANAGDFRLLDGRVVAALRRVNERSRFMKGIFAWVGFRQVGVPFDVQERQGGSSSFSFFRLLAFARTGITAFSSFPLRVCGHLGFVVSLAALIYGFMVTTRTLVYGSDVPGYATIVILILFLGGVQLISLGVVGEYLARVFIEVKERPLYIVDRRLGFEDSENNR